MLVTSRGVIPGSASNEIASKRNGRCVGYDLVIRGAQDEVLVLTPRTAAFNEKEVDWSPWSRPYIVVCCFDGHVGQHLGKSRLSNVSSCQALHIERKPSGTYVVRCQRRLPRGPGPPTKRTGTFGYMYTRTNRTKRVFFHPPVAERRCRRDKQGRGHRRSEPRSHGAERKDARRAGEGGADGRAEHSFAGVGAERVGEEKEGQVLVWWGFLCCSCKRVPCCRFRL